MKQTQISISASKQQQTKASTTFVPLPIVHAINGADEILGPDRIWKSINQS
jgi:hypothetical protein